MNDIEKLVAEFVETKYDKKEWLRKILEVKQETFALMAANGEKPRFASLHEYVQRTIINGDFHADYECHTTALRVLATYGQQYANEA